MREIKFRAWDAKRQRMIDWSECRKRFSFEALEKKPHEFMQYTSLKDRNDIDIYDRDFVVFKFKGGDIKRLVRWDERTYAWQFDRFHYTLSEIKECEVIGNIYQNPELLE